DIRTSHGRNTNQRNAQLVLAEIWPWARSAQLTSFFGSRLAQRTSFYVVASCGLLPRTTRPGPRVRTAYPAVAILPLRDTRESWTWSPVYLARTPASFAQRPVRFGSSTG